MNLINLYQYRDLLNDYSELRAQENRSMTLSMLNGQLVTNSSSIESGISCRSLKNGSWGFASYPAFSRQAIEKVVQEAKRNAEFLSGKMQSKQAQLKIPGANAKIDISSKKNEKLKTETLIDLLKEFDASMAAKYPELVNRGLRCFQQDFIKEGINSEGANTYTHYARSYLVVSMAIDSENGPVEVREVLGNKGQLEDTFPNFQEFEDAIDRAYVHLKAKAFGIMPSSGLREVILSSKLAGILAHEAIGHTTEADIVLGGSVAGSYLGEKVASDKVSLVDFAHTAFGQQAPMPVLFDDEGTPAEDTLIIENGILKSFMNSKETALHFQQKATGHARAWGFNDEPLIRMRNTAILPGADKLADMISSIDDGYYLMDHSNGQADSTSEFMFGVTMGYEIKKGKLGRALLDTTIAGVAFDMLKTVTMVSDEVTWVSYGTCGKKQPMTVGMGGPAIKCSINIGGK